MFTVNNLFPTPIITSNIQREITQEELSIVETHRTLVYNNMGNITSLDTYILNTNFPDIKNFIDLGIKYYVDNVLCPKHSLEFYITQSWLNYTDQGNYHHKHVHPNSIFSGVFYFNAEENKDKIHFFNDVYQQIQIPTENYNMFNSKSWWFPVKTGDLVLFPSSTSHMVEQTTSTTTRISLAFNVFARGYLGDEQFLTCLRL